MYTFVRLYRVLTFSYWAFQHEWSQRLSAASVNVTILGGKGVGQESVFIDLRCEHSIAHNPHRPPEWDKVKILAGKRHRCSPWRAIRLLTHMGLTVDSIHICWFMHSDSGPAIDSKLPNLPWWYVLSSRNNPLTQTCYLISLYLTKLCANITSRHRITFVHSGVQVCGD